MSGAQPTSTATQHLEIASHARRNGRAVRGLLGLLLLLVLYLSLVGRGLWIASQAQDTFTRLLAGTLSLTFFFYVFVNAGMVSGLLPIVGVPLPLVSAGGTSMVTLMAGFGMLASIHGHRKLMAP